ncbi:MAG: DNA repair protein RecO [Aeriscardovia sp.]|nr:DNA repair protein RecO [Aeriscardovia sp.]
MPLYSDEGIVLRTAKLGETDRIITLLTRNHGKVRAVASGARRVKSRFGARLEPFMRDSVLCATGRSLDHVSQAVCTGAYARPIIADYGSYLAASAMCETTDKLLDTEHEPAPAHYQLLLGALIALAQRRHQPWQIGESYVLRAMTLAGWCPRLSSCVVCGRADGLTSFSVRLGGALCRSDRAAGAVELTEAQFVQLQALSLGDWDRCGGRRDARVAALVEEWAQYYLERPLWSLRLLDYET